MSGQKFRLDISVSIQQTEPWPGGRLEVRENMDLSADGFMEVASILHRFHELAEKLAKEQ